MSNFDSFTPDAFRFFADLEGDNTRTFWHSNKQRWEHSVRAPMLAFLAALPDEYGPFHVFRMNRDVRFSTDKSPYKTMFGAASERCGAIRYVHLEASGVLAAAGHYTMTADQLERFRAAVAHAQSGAELDRTIGMLETAALTIGPGLAPPLKTAPRGYSVDHPRIHLLRWKGAMASQTFSQAVCSNGSRLVDAVVAFWRHAAPLNAWLEQHVGPTREHIVSQL